MNILKHFSWYTLARDYSSLNYYFCLKTNKQEKFWFSILILEKKTFWNTENSHKMGKFVLTTTKTLVQDCSFPCGVFC